VTSRKLVDAERDVERVIFHVAILPPLNRGLWARCGSVKREGPFRTNEYDVS